MAITRVTCPKCDTGLKSPTGFDVGQVIQCPKCKKQFEVEEPEEEVPVRPAKGKKPVKAAVVDDDDEEDEEEEEERPRKKKKKKRRDEDDDEDAKSNTAFYIRLGVLLLILIGLGIAFIVLGPGGLNQNKQ